MLLSMAEDGAGLPGAGATASYKVYVILTTGNEAGSAAGSAAGSGGGGPDEGGKWFPAPFPQVGGGAFLWPCCG